MNQRTVEMCTHDGTSPLNWLRKHLRSRSRDDDAAVHAAERGSRA